MTLPASLAPTHKQLQVFMGVAGGVVAEGRPVSDNNLSIFEATPEDALI